mmetsp:Transcript_15170/g.34569  ORF Transcript_15170/g.34569 Transcript_15170/m.34569 type:complete len:943 (-) Transcript_15170:60-2888(-)
MAAKDDESERNPLSFLDRLLKTERDSNLHFGDVRFWQHLGYIDRAQIYRTSSLEYRTLKLMFCEALFYIIFLVSFTAYVNEVGSRQLFEARRQQLDYWGDCRPDEDGFRGKGPCDIHNVQDADSLWTWLKDSLAPKAFTERELYSEIVSSPSLYRISEGTNAWAPRYAGDTRTSVIVGAIRIRQLRVQYNPKDCEILEEWKGIHEDCFPRFSDGVQSRLSWAPTWTPEHLIHHYEWSANKNTEQTWMSGYNGQYPGDGFYFDLPLNLTGAQTRLQELSQWSWIDRRTRALIVELSTLNPNVNIFVWNRMLFEFPAMGGVQVVHEAFAFRVFQLSLALTQSDDNSIFLYQIALCALHLLYLGYVIFLMYKNGFRYWMYFWSWFDIAILGLYFILLGVQSGVYYTAAREPTLKPEVIADPEMFLTIGKLVSDMQLANNIFAVLAVFVWLKVLKYFSLMGWFAALVRVTERCVIKLVVFSALFLIVLFGFAVAFHVLYGDRGTVFETLKGAYIAVIIAPAGGVDWQPILGKNDTWGPLLIVAYILIILFLLLSTFMAIVVDCYSVVSFEMHEVSAMSKNWPTRTFLWTFWNALKGIKLVGKESEEDKGGDHEQEILLSSLPEALSSRFEQKRKEMQAIFDGANSEIEESRIDELRRRGILDAPDNKKSKKEKKRKRAREAKANMDSNLLAITDDPGEKESDDESWDPLAEEMAETIEEGIDLTIEKNDMSEKDPRLDGAKLVVKMLQKGDLDVDKIDKVLQASYKVGASDRDPHMEAMRDASRQIRDRQRGAEIQEKAKEMKAVEANRKHIVVNRVQIQRMLDEDPSLREICGTSKAIDVMRRFHVEDAGVDPYEAVERLQKSVVQKLQELEEHGTTLEFSDMETLRTVSAELHNALTDAQKDWRAELLSVMQMASLLSKALVDLTKKLEQVQMNHHHLAMYAKT